MNTEQINELERLEQAATPAPWTGVKTFVENSRAYLCSSPTHLIFACDSDDRLQAGSAVENDADLIATARNALPAIIRDWRIMRQALVEITIAAKSDYYGGSYRALAETALEEIDNGY